jgi:hypothetical protein
MEKINYESRECRRWSVSRRWLRIILVITQSFKLLTVNSVLTEDLRLFLEQGKDVLAEIKHAWTCALLNFSLANANQCNKKRHNTKHHVLCHKRKGLLLRVQDISKQARYRQIIPCTSRENIWEGDYINVVSLIFNINITWEIVDSFTLRPRYPWGSIPRHTFN